MWQTPQGPPERPPSSAVLLALGKISLPGPFANLYEDRVRPDGSETESNNCMPPYHTSASRPVTEPDSRPDEGRRLWSARRPGPTAHPWSAVPARLHAPPTRSWGTRLCSGLWGTAAPGAGGTGVLRGPHWAAGTGAAWYHPYLLGSPPPHGPSGTRCGLPGLGPGHGACAERCRLQEALAPVPAGESAWPLRTQISP